jgi:hypothetical protein
MARKSGPSKRFGPPTCRVCSYPLDKGKWLEYPKKKWNWQCRDCLNAYARTFKATNTKNKKKWHRDNPERVIYTRAKSRAKRDNLPFDLELSDIVIPSHCPVLNIPLVLAEDHVKGNSPTLDKIVPSKGYVKGNVCIISHRANTIKNDASQEDLEKVLAWLKEQLKNV